MGPTDPFNADGQLSVSALRQVAADAAMAGQLLAGSGYSFAGGGGLVVVPDTGDGAGVTVAEADGTPAYTDITTIQVDQAQGGVVTNPSTGVAKISWQDATALAPGIVSAGTQSFGGAKTFTQAVAINTQVSLDLSGLDGSKVYYAGAGSTYVASKDSGKEARVYVNANPEAIQFWGQGTYPDLQLRDGTTTLTGQTITTGGLTFTKGLLTGGSISAAGTVTSIDASGGTTGLSFTGGPITTSGTLTLGGTLAVASGGTGAGTASGARTNLGLAIGTNVQAWDADLDALAALAGTNTIYYRSAANTWSPVTVTAGLSFVASNLGIGDAAVGALVGLVPAADRLAYYTGASTAAITTLTSFGRGLIDDTDAATARTTLGLGTISTQDASNVSITGGSITGITDLAVADGGTGASTASGARANLGLAIGSDVQAYDAELAVLAGLTFAANSLVLLTGAATATVGKLTNAYVDSAAAIDWSKISKTGSSLADLATRSASDLSSGTLAVARGGTNLSSYTTGDLLYASGASALASLGIGTAGYLLTVSGGLPAWLSPTTLPTFVAAGGSAAKGIVPAPGGTAHSNRPYYLGDDAAWHARLGECLGTAWVATGETTTSGSPADLATSQSVTFTLDETSNVLALASAEASNTGANANVIYVYNGTTSQEVSRVTGTTTNCVSGGYVQSLAAGTYTFKMRFATGAGTATFSNRMFSVWRV